MILIYDRQATDDLYDCVQTVCGSQLVGRINLWIVQTCGSYKRFTTEFRREVC